MMQWEYTDEDNEEAAEMTELLKGALVKLEAGRFTESHYDKVTDAAYEIVDKHAGNSTDPTPELNSLFHYLILLEERYGEQ